MYPILLAFHSFWRWVVLITLIFTTLRAYIYWKKEYKFSVFDNKIRHVVATIAQIQLVLGVWLYFISPIVEYFLRNFKTAVHEREIRFFGMEHIVVMISAIVVITIGSMKSKRAVADKQKFKIMAIWFSIALLLILTSIPWSFSPLISRPYFRVSEYLFKISLYPD